MTANKYQKEKILTLKEAIQIDGQRHLSICEIGNYFSDNPIILDKYFSPCINVFLQNTGYPYQKLQSLFHNVAVYLSILL